VDNLDDSNIESGYIDGGSKTIRLESTSSDGLANIDYIQIDGVNLTTAACE
jgi:hypothetical protein